MPPALGNIQAGKLRAIAVASPTRTSLLPDVPTFAESGMPGFEAVLHYGLLAPAGTPRADRRQAQCRTAQAGRNDEVKKRIHSEGGDPLTSSPDEYAADIDQEEAKWSTLDPQAQSEGGIVSSVAASAILGQSLIIHSAKFPPRLLKKRNALGGVRGGASSVAAVACRDRAVSCWRGLC